MTNKTIIIIGGGHNGLVCATYLAKEGHNVTVLEARDKLGGSASKHVFAEGYHVAGLAHVIHPLNPKIVKELGLKIKKGAAIDTISLSEDGNHLILGKDSVKGGNLSADDIAAYKDFKKEFRKYAKALEPLTINKPPRLKDMDNKDKFTLAKIGWSLRFGLGTSSMREFLRVGGINIYDVLNEVIDDPQLKGAIAADAVIGHHMGPRTPTTVLTYLNRLRGETYGPPTLPQAVGDHFVEVMIKAATMAGVHIEKGARVKRIIVNDGKAGGVELTSGEERIADMVISNADAKTTFLDLVGAAEMDAMFAQRINTTRTNGTVAKLHFALNKLPEIEGLSNGEMSQRLIVAPDMRYVEHAFNHAKYGEYSEKPVLEITFPTLADPSLAPDGHHVMSVSASFAPYSIKGGWDQSRSAFSHKVLSLIEKYAPGISSHVVASEILTPKDIEQQFNVTGGHWHHGELTIDQSFMMRPVHGTAQYNTPIDGLFLCGASAHPGGGITGIPGHNAAKRILSMKGGE
ncbi:MAG: NAD(P)/FAD-dependent oxidoreductase [Kordiimonadaceae bacterium]|nr:NAD(P)/FAD-dependent oxidoreductase [Kordiimonadaceae bacterium]